MKAWLLRKLLGAQLAYVQHCKARLEVLEEINADLIRKEWQATRRARMAESRLKEIEPVKRVVNGDK